MATRQELIRRAFAQVTRSMTSHGEAVVHWLRRYSTGAIRFPTSTWEALRHWLKGISTDDIVVDAETKVENLGTVEIPINLPRITINRRTNHKLVVFNYVEA